MCACNFSLLVTVHSLRLLTSLVQYLCLFSWFYPQTILRLPYIARHYVLLDLCVSRCHRVMLMVRFVCSCV